MIRRSSFLIMLVLALLAGTGLSAQRSGILDAIKVAPSTFSMVVQTNVAGAIIQINNDVVRGNQFNLPPAVYRVTVRAPGYRDFSTNINLQSDQVVNAILVAEVQNFNLVIRSNVRDATIQINNNIVRGSRFNLAAAVYAITVRAPGYADFTTTVDLHSDQVVEARLVPQSQDANLFISSNVKGAQVFINDTLVGIVGARFTIPAGTYQLRVSAPGYQDFVSSVQISGNQTVNAMLNPIAPVNAVLTIISNVKTAQVFLNNNPVGNVGTSYTLVPGSYQIRVTSPGYTDYVTTINLNGNQTVNANLAAPNYTLTVSANVQNAQVFLNNNPVGAADQTFSLVPGSYQLRVSAPGYQDFQTQIQLNGNQVVNAVLQGFNGKLVVEMPRNTALQVFIDGKIQKRAESISLPAGQHRVRFELGFMSAETVVNIVSGQTVTVVPVFSVMVK